MRKNTEVYMILAIDVFGGSCLYLLEKMEAKKSDLPARVLGVFSQPRLAQHASVALTAENCNGALAKLITKKKFVKFTVVCSL